MNRRVVLGAAASGMVLALAAGSYLVRDLQRTTRPGPEGPGPYFVADFETGDISQWEGLSNKTKDTAVFEITSDIVRAGRYALKITLMPCDDPSPRRDRAEFIQREGGGLAYEGHERFYGFSFMVPDDFRHAGEGYFLITQWHGMDRDVPPLLVTYQAEGLRLGGRRFGWVNLGPVERNKWTDLVLRVTWSTTEGEVDVWRDNDLVARLKAPTLNDEDAAHYYRAGTYLKFGPYRGVDIDYPQTIYVDEYRIGGSYEEVAPGQGV